MPSYHDRGVVLRTTKLGESDRIIAILTEEHGQVRAVAKGVRKTTSKFGGRLEPASHVVVMCWKGRDLDIVQQVQVIDAFRAIKEDLSRLAAAAAVLELSAKLSSEGNPDPALYRMLVGALAVIEKDNPPLVKAGFYLKSLALEGSSPVVDACVRCGDGDELVAFDMGQGGLLCRKCRSGTPVSPEAISAMRFVLGGRLAEALGAVAEPVAGEVEALSRQAVEYYLGTRLRARSLD